MFWAYMLHCRGGVFYTGHTEDLERRMGEHQSGLMPGFTSRYLPVELVWSQDFPTRYEALSAERQIKGWSRKKKLALIRSDWTEIQRLAKSKNGPSTGSGRTAIGVQALVIDTIEADAVTAYPKECCGLLLGRGGLIQTVRPTANLAADPLKHFEIDPQALIDAHRAERAGGLEVIGYYHSHPQGPAAPSATDRAQAARDGRVWAIAGVEGVTFWRDGESGFERLSCESLDG